MAMNRFSFTETFSLLYHRHDFNRKLTLSSTTGVSYKKPLLKLEVIICCPFHSKVFYTINLIF